MYTKYNIPKGEYLGFVPFKGNEDALVAEGKKRGLPFLNYRGIYKGAEFLGDELWACKREDCEDLVGSLYP